MYLDVFTLSALVDEFMDILVGGRIQDALDVDETGVGLEIYAHHKRQYLYLSADTNVPRLHITTEKLRRGTERPTTLGLLIRRYVEGGKIVHVSQPDWERVIHLHLETAEGEMELVIEPMERRSNILLVQNGIILDCMRRVGADENRVRVSLPNHPYVPPPKQIGKRNPFIVTETDIQGFITQTTDPKARTYQILTANLLGMSPLLAREIVYRACEDTKQKVTSANAGDLQVALEMVLEPLRKRDWQAGIIEENGRVEAYSPYPIEHLPNWKRVDTISKALVAFYGAPVGENAYNAAKIPVRLALQEASRKYKSKLFSLESSLKDDSEREQLKQSGELILAYQFTIQKGQTELKAQYEVDGAMLSIKLDPTLTPLENAQAYFARYNKAKRALEDVPRLVNETKVHLNTLAQLENDLEMANNWGDIDEVSASLIANGYVKGKRAKRIGGAGQSAPLRLVTQDGFVIWVGKNSRQNELVTFKRGSAEDFWLHARDVPGAHVVIKFDGRTIPPSLIEQAASIAAYYSARRADGKVPVDMTRCKYVKKIKGAAQGMVTYRNEQTLTASPKSEKEFDFL